MESADPRLPVPDAERASTCPLPLARPIARADKPGPLITRVASEVSARSNVPSDRRIDDLTNDARGCRTTYGPATTSPRASVSWLGSARLGCHLCRCLLFVLLFLSSRSALASRADRSFILIALPLHCYLNIIRNANASDASRVPFLSSLWHRRIFIRAYDPVK